MKEILSYEMKKNAFYMALGAVVTATVITMINYIDVGTIKIQLLYQESEISNLKAELAKKADKK